MNAMDEQPVLMTQARGELTLTLQRAHKANALTAAMMRALAQALATTDGSEVVVLRSASPTLFCAGADIAEFAAGAERLAKQEHALLVLIERMACCRTPIVVLARGRASGAGAILLSLADVVVAADDLQLSCPEIRFGMYPVIVEAVLQSRMPPALASRLCLGGHALDAGEAHRIGLVTDLVPAGEFEAQSLERLQFYRERHTALLIARRSRLRSQPPERLIEKVRVVAPLMAENFASPGVRERILVYLGGLKRKA